MGAEKETTLEYEQPQRSNIPLCVDLDGTLIRSDLLIESVLVLARKDPLSLLRIPGWLMRGKAHLKTQLARRVDIDPALLPYNAPLLDFLNVEHSRGRELVLATASHEKHARAVADHLGLFSSVIATKNHHNLSGDRKRLELVAAYGAQGFDYAANAMTDLAVWRHANGALLVGASNRVQRLARRAVDVRMVFPRASFSLYQYVRALRLHQWVKNALVFVPALAAQQLANPMTFLQAATAFLAFSLCASSVYLFNDLLDLQADRQHARKKERPFASGRIPLTHGFVLAPVLLLASISISFALPGVFLIILLGYYTATLLYSFWLKDHVVVDVLVLASLFTFRILGGAAATSILPSFWLLAFSMFLFLSLALVKRSAELVSVQKSGGSRASGRGYFTSDLPLLESIGTGTAYTAVLVLALYINSSDVHKMYNKPQLLWLLCPIMLYWVTRIWMKTHRDEMHEDPIVFAISDRTSLIAVILIVVVLSVASH